MKKTTFAAKLRRYSTVALLSLILTLGFAGVASAQCGAQTADNATDRQTIASAIANGHAWTKHSDEFVQGKDIAGLSYPGPTISNQTEFDALLYNIITNPSDHKDLNSNRRAYWDDSTGTIVIFNPKPNDCGTAFRPTDGKAYFNKQQ